MQGQRVHEPEETEVPEPTQEGETETTPQPGDQPENESRVADEAW